jgi:antitoxin MazE
MVPGAAGAMLPRDSAGIPSIDSRWIYNGIGISIMRVSKWGNSLAVRLPAVVVDALDLKEGDEIEISIAGKRDFRVARDRSKERAIEQLRQMKWSFPPGFKFDREEINER